MRYMYFNAFLELQIQNENLSLKLQEEIENREEILEKYIICLPFKECILIILSIEFLVN